jgi:hypothetical protein
MQELFAPEAPTSEAGIAASRSFAEPRLQISDDGDGAGEERSEELDLDRRAPLAMRIEVAPEPAAPPARSTTGGSGPTATRRGTPAPARDDAAQLAADALADPAAADGIGPTGAQKTSRPTSWLVIALFIAIGVAAMVIMTLK